MKKNTTLKGLTSYRNFNFYRMTGKFFACLLLISVISTNILAQNNAVFGWGYNNNYQFGIGYTSQENSPVQLFCSTNWKSIVAGDYDNAAIKTDGSLWTWGGSTNPPVQVGTSTDWAKVESGSYFKMAIKTDGTLWGWGVNFHGQLGIGNNTNQSNPVQVGTDNDWVSVACGGTHTIALKSDGTLWSWGYNDYGNLGLGNNTSYNTPIQIGTDTNWVSIGSGAIQSFAIKSNGTLWGWGHNVYGQVGDGTIYQANSPVQIGSATNWVFVTGGYSHSAGIQSDGTLWLWGQNNFGQIGDGSNTNQITPKKIGSATDWAFIDCGTYRTSAIKTDGTLYAWGINPQGQLGIGNTTNQNSPVQVGTETNWTSVAIGGLHTMGLAISAVAPTGTNTYTGNVTISTQTQLNAFYNTTPGPNYGKRYTQIVGNLTLDGSSSTDPITSFCNLSSLTEISRVNGVGGGLIITNFNNVSNPTTLSNLAALTTVGCTFSVTDCPQLTDLTLPNLTSIGCSMNINNNASLLIINMPLLQTMGGDQFNIRNNPKLLNLFFSASASSFSFTGKGSSVDISNNGNTATGYLNMYLQKITKIRGALVFNNNDNPGVANFDYIFAGLTALETAWGKYYITNNDYLYTCCVLANVTVSGTGKRHIISGNAAHCADSITIKNLCGPFHKRTENSLKPAVTAVDLLVYPNPSKGVFEMNFKGNNVGQLNYSISDINGRVLTSQSIMIGPDDILPIQLGNFAEGTYVLKAELNGEVFAKRLMVVK